MLNKIILFISPIILLVEIIAISWITELLRQPSDVAVIAGFILAYIFFMSNFYLLKLIIKQFKQKVK